MKDLALIALGVALYGAAFVLTAAALLLVGVGLGTLLYFAQ